MFFKLIKRKLSSHETSHESRGSKSHVMHLGKSYHQSTTISVRKLDGSVPKNENCLIFLNNGHHFQDTVDNGTYTWSSQTKIHKIIPMSDITNIDYEIEKTRKELVNKIKFKKEEVILSLHDLCIGQYDYTTIDSPIKIKEDISNINMLVMFRCMCSRHLGEIDKLQQEELTTKLIHFKNNACTKFNSLGGLEFDCFDLRKNERGQSELFIYLKNSAKCVSCYM